MQYTPNSLVRLGDISEQLHGLSPEQCLVDAVKRSAVKPVSVAIAVCIDDDGGVTF